MENKQENWLMKLILSLFGSQKPPVKHAAELIDEDMTPEEIEYLRKVATSGQQYGIKTK